MGSRVITLLRRRSGISPDQVAGLQLWLKADAGLYQDSAGATPAAADGDPVGRWSDQSGNGRHATQATAAKRLTLRTGGNGVNGLPALRADGVDDYLETGVLPAYASFTAFFVVRRVGAPTGYSHLAGSLPGYTASGADFWQLYAPSGGTFQLNFDPVSLDISTAVPFSTSAVLVSVRKDDAGAGSSEMWLDGEIGGAGAGNETIASHALFLGAWNSNAYHGDLLEVILYDSALPDNDRRGVESYLRSRWGTA